MCQAVNQVFCRYGASNPFAGIKPVIFGFLIAAINGDFPDISPVIIFAGRPCFRQPYPDKAGFYGKPFRRNVARLIMLRLFCNCFPMLCVLGILQNGIMKIVVVCIILRL